MSFQKQVLEYGRRARKGVIALVKALWVFAQEGVAAERVRPLRRVKKQDFVLERRVDPPKKILSYLLVGIEKKQAAALIDVVEQQLEQQVRLTHAGLADQPQPVRAMRVSEPHFLIRSRVVAEDKVIRHRRPFQENIPISRGSVAPI